ncbi:MAG: bifunctional DNA primase/polymerase [Elusimicrobia bacterium]|nr:bifunctional DNA primase/polymerase [Elusimicrobiota bacterium]
MSLSRLERALEYVGRGWAVFPLAPNSKIPLPGSHGFKEATTDPEQVLAWWKDNPERNIGIATGLKSRLLVVDVDVKNGAKGKESLASIPGLTSTRTARTPSGGSHLFYRSPNYSIRSRIGFLPGIDIKADGGYVVAPGSSINGKIYEWI